MANPKVVYRKKLAGVTKYEYCPYCIMPFLKDGSDYRASIQPLFYEKTEEFENGKYIPDAYWVCHRCNTKLTETDFINVYAARFDRTKYTEDSKPFTRNIYKAGVLLGTETVKYTKDGELVRID